MLQSIFDRHRRRRAASGAALLIGMAALAVSERTASDVSWESLLAPYSQGALLPEGFRIDAIRRGAGNDVVLEVRRAGEDTVGVEVHVVTRGRWTGGRGMLLGASLALLALIALVRSPASRSLPSICSPASPASRSLRTTSAPFGRCLRRRYWSSWRCAVSPPWRLRTDSLPWRSSHSR